MFLHKSVHQRMDIGKCCVYHVPQAKESGTDVAKESSSKALSPFKRPQSMTLRQCYNFIIDSCSTL